MAGKPQPRMSVVQPLYTSYRYIPLTHNLVAIVDADNYEWLMTFSWSACKDSKGIVYAISNIVLPNGRRTRLRMHRLILGLHYGDPREGDHIRPADTLDNRRENLRIVDQHQSACNRRKFKNNTSGYKGVSFYKRLQMYAAGIRFHGKRKNLGYRLTAKAAYEELYVPAALELHGEYARLV